MNLVYHLLDALGKLDKKATITVGDLVKVLEKCSVEMTADEQDKWYGQDWEE